MENIIENKEKYIWILAFCNSDGENIFIKKVNGTIEQVKKCLITYIYDTIKETESPFDYGCTKKEDFMIRHEGAEIYGYAVFADFHVDVSAVREDSIKIEEF